MRLPHEHTVKLSGKLPSGHFNYGFKSPTFLPFSRLTLMCVVVPIIISTHTNALPTGLLSVTHIFFENLKMMRITVWHAEKEVLNCNKPLWNTHFWNIPKPGSQPQTDLMQWATAEQLLIYNRFVCERNHWLPLNFFLFHFDVMVG